MAFWKESMINRLSNLINRNCSAAKISQVLCSKVNPNINMTTLSFKVTINRQIDPRKGPLINMDA